ncbi:Histidine kinase-%2C DNA gyrase B-%2C and HSP90-like ATPase [Mycobacterium tuberculosis]|nr:Histidine kinase-%2C DNA gyrase B-%2C and HSP90-like ATPase [Mycobacterium tuberculosis]
MGLEDVVGTAIPGEPGHGNAGVPGRAVPGGPGPGAARRGGGGAVGRARERVVLGEVTLPGVRRSVGVARGFVRDLAADLPAVDDLVTVVSETVANAVTHTASGLPGGSVTVVLTEGAGVYRLEVADDGAAGGRPHVKAEPGAETGRGMRIVEALAARWGFRADGPRTVVWAEFPAPPAGERGRGRDAPVSGPG